MTHSTHTASSLHAFSDDALGTDDAVSLAEKLKSSKLSVQELEHAARTRARHVNPKLQAITFHQNTLPQTKLTAKAKDQQAFFAGIPSYMKDNVELKGFPTSFGSNAFRPKVANKDGFYASQFLKTGVNILGKSSLPEFGLNASTEPMHTDATRNPWHLEYSSGASSGGAAALVAAGVVPFAHGNDGGGSIRIPASCCGLVGLKPSRNRHVNEAAARSLPINIVSEGILSRSVRDTAYFHFELQKHYQAKKLPTLPLVTHAAKKRLKIGMYIESFEGYPVDRETQQAVEASAALLSSLGHDVEYIKFPVNEQFAEDFGLYWGMLAYMLKKTGPLLIDRQFKARDLDPLSLGLARHYRHNMLKTPVFLHRLKKAARQFREGFQNFDLYLSPVLNKTTRPLGELHPGIGFEALFDRLKHYAGFTPMANIAGTPAISLPMGQTASGLPIGIQFNADMGQEQRLLEIAYELEEAQPWQHLFVQ